MDLLILTLVMLCVAAAYSSVGLGGGSAYLAILALGNISVQQMPIISLTLNIIVSFLAAWNYVRYGHSRIRSAIPYLIGSLPFAYLGGLLRLPVKTFQILLMITLVGIALRIYFMKPEPLARIDIGRWSAWLPYAIGAVLGFLAGAVGIGGGIFLVPVMIMLGLAGVKEAAGIGAIFIWVNSLIGLVARLSHTDADPAILLPLIPAVFIGGWIGSYFGSARLSPRVVQQILGAVVVAAVISLGIKNI